jgi:hypothetical protein
MKRRTEDDLVNRQEPETTGPLPHYDLAGLDHEELSKQNLAEIGAQRTKRELEEHNSTSPALTGGDLDADWQGAESVGDEAVGGHASTPDQNNVDEIGEAVGFDSGDAEELRTVEERAARRDRNRWELDRRSAADDTSAR